MCVAVEIERKVNFDRKTFRWINPHNSHRNIRFPYQLSAPIPTSSSPLIIAHFPFDSIALVADEREHMYFGCEKIARQCVLKMPQRITINVCEGVESCLCKSRRIQKKHEGLEHLTSTGWSETRICEMGNEEEQKNTAENPQSHLGEITSTYRFDGERKEMCDVADA